MEGSALSKITDVATELVTFAGSLFQTILDNPVMLIFIAAGLIPIGFGIVRGMKRTAGSH